MLSKMLSSGGSNLLALGITFATTIVLGRFLDPDSRGIVAKVMTLIMVAAVLGSFSIPSFIVRQSILRGEEVELLVLQYRVPALLLALITAMVAGSVVLVSFEKKISAVASIVVGAVVVIESIKGLLTATATRKSRFLLLNLSRILAPLSYLVALSFFWLSKNFDLYAVLWSFLISQFLGVVPLLKNSEVLFTRQNSKNALPNLKNELFIHHLGLALGFLSLQADRLILSSFFSNADVGRFFVAYALCSIPNMLIQPIVPQLIGSGAGNELRIKSLLSAVSVVAFLFLVLFVLYGVETVVLVFGSQYTFGMDSLVPALSVYATLLSFKQLAISFLLLRGKGGFAVTYLEVIYILFYVPLALTCGLDSISRLVWLNALAICVPLGLSIFYLKAGRLGSGDKLNQ